MAAPDFVPQQPARRVRAYTSPPRRPDSWVPDRPGELPTGQPHGARLGTIGPDQGYAYRLVKQFDGRLELGRVSHDDATAGCVAVAMKRSGLFGRAPVVHDLTAAFTLFGFLDASPPAELVELREKLFAQVHSPHHYVELRHLVDLVPADVLRSSHDAIATAYRSDWRSNLALAH
ncbi:MAG: hypothetical protein R2761_31745 [Acidimicrobiales bacterium]